MYRENEASAPDPVRTSLEEVVEESGVTDLRNDLLQTIERIQENPALRVVIRKHGKPRAVLMSMPAYDALRRLVNLVVQHSDEMDSKQRLELAYRRLKEERPRIQERTIPVTVTPLGQPISVHGAADARIIVGEINEKLRELHSALERAEGMTG